MARISQGDTLATALLQPGAKFQEDGYKLTTGTCVFKSDRTASVGGIITRGSACPVSAYSYCKAHRFSVTFDSLGVATYTVDYVGIDPAGGSVYTDPQITSTQGLTSENVTSHPNFFELASTLGFTGSPIAGVGPSPGSKASPNYQPVTSGDGRTEYVGNNGATFEKKTGGKFLGFKVPNNSDFYGKSNYLAAQTSFAGHFYTTSSTVPRNYVNAVGKTSSDGTFVSGLDLLPAYMGSSFTYDGKNQLLLSQVSVEDFGSLYKVNYEIRYNRDGYNSSVYASA